METAGLEIFWNDRNQIMGGPVVSTGRSTFE